MKYIYNAIFQIFLLFFMTGCENFNYYNSPGGVQIIATKETLYVFLQINRQKASSLKYYDAPSVYPISNTLKLLELDSDGTYSVKDIDLPKGFNLNPNISHLFFYENNIYFFADTGYRIGDELLLLKLKNGILYEVPIDDKELNSIIDEERRKITYVDIDAFSIKQGASLVKSYRNIDEKSNFVWNQRQINISLDEDIDSFSFVINAGTLLNIPIRVLIHESHEITSEKLRTF